MSRDIIRRRKHNTNLNSEQNETVSRKEKNESCICKKYSYKCDFLQIHIRKKAFVNYLTPKGTQGDDYVCMYIRKHL